MIVVTPPEKIAFARDRVVWKFKDAVRTSRPGVAANVLKFTGAVPHGTQLVLRWQNGDLRLRASDNPDNSGAEFPSGDGGLTYVQELAQWFEKNYYISEDFTVTQASYESQPSIYLYARRGGTAYSMAPTTFTGGSVIRYASGSDGKTRVNNSVFVEVKVRADNAWDYTTAYKGVLPLDDARTASLDVGEILAAYLKNELPTFGLPEATKLIFSCRDYYIRYAHAGGEPFSIGQVETTEKYYITTGGHSTMGAENRSVETTLKGATAAQDKFLTLQDRTRFVRVDESLYLSFINLRTARTWIAAQATVTYEDDTTTTTNTNVINNVQPYEKIRFGVGYPQFNLGAFPKRVKEYSVKLIDNSGATISETIRCIVDYSHREYIRYMAYFNSHGGVELLKTYGKASAEFRISKEVVERVLPDMFAAREPQFVNWGATLTEIVEVASGFIPHRQLGHFLDFFLSDQQYRVANNTAYPIIVNTDEVKKGTDGENFSAIVFQFRYARHTDSVGAADLDRLSDTFAITPGVQVAGEVLLNAPGGEWSGVIDPFPVSGSDNPVASGGVWSMLQSYQPLITTGNITQYFRGDFSLGDLATDVPANETDPTVPDFAKTLNNLSTLLTLLKTVDGEGSGLDADLWRGKTPGDITVWKSTQWAQKRKITVGGAMTGEVELDGSENVTLTLEKNFDIIGELTFTGDVTGTGTGEIELLLAEITSEGTYTKVTVNKKGLVTNGDTLEASDIPSLSSSKISNFAASVRATALTGISIPGTPTLVSEEQSVMGGIAAIQSQINSFSSGTPNKVPVANSNGLFVDSIISSSANRVSIGEGTESGSWMLYVEGNIITKGILASTIADGTAPLSVVSKTMVPNLNAHMLGGYEASYFLNATNIQFGQLSPDVLAPTGVESGRYSVVTVDEKGRVIEGRQLTYGDIAHALPDANKYDPRGPRFHRFSRVYIEECAEIDPPIVFDYATKISSHHLPSDLSVKFIVKNFKSQGIEVANSGLVITLTGMPEFTFDADEIAVVFEDTEGNQRIVPLDVSVVPAENNVPACPVGYPTIVDIVEASTTGMRPEINYSTIEKLRWRVKQSGQVVAQGTLFTADIPSPVNQPWISFPAPLAAGAYVFEIEGESCSSSVASKSFTITVPSTNYSIVPKYYDLTSGTPVYVMDITPGAILPWKAKYNIKAEISGLHNQVAMSLTTAGTNQMSWGPENIGPGGASTNNSAPWIFGPAGHSNGRPAGQATIRTRAYLQNVLVEDVSISFTLQESVPSTGTNFYFGTHFVDGEDETLINEVQMTENGTYQLPQAPSLYGLRIDHVVGNWMSYYEIYMEVLVGGQWQALRVASAPNHQPYIKAGAIEDIALSFVFSIPTTLINNATGQVFNPHQPGAYRVSIAGTHEGVVVGSAVVTYNLTQNNSPTGLLTNPGVEQVTIGDTLYEMIGDGQAYFEVLPDGKVKIHAPVTKPSFNSARTCNRFLHGGNNSEKIDDADAAALFGSGLLLPPGLHTFVIHYYAATSIDEVYDDPWKFAIEENPESAGYCAAMHTLDIFIYNSSSPTTPSS